MDGKKKKNRKKKGNQNTVANDGTPYAEEVVVPEADNGSASDPNHQVQALGNSDVQSVGVSESDMELERLKIYESRCIKLQGDVRQLEDEKSLWLRKEACLDEKIRVLQNQVESCIQKEALLEENFKDLQVGNNYSMQKQIALEDKFRHIEGIEDTWNLKEMSIKGMIARLDEANVGLEMQVMELKESRDSLLQENQQLKESIPLLESRIQCLEREASFHRSSMSTITKQLPEENNLQYQVEAAPEPMNKLDSDNTVLEKVAHELPGEKVNEMHIEPDQHTLAAEAPTTGLDHVTSPFRAATPGDEAESSEKIQSLERIHETFSIHHGTEDFGADTRLRQVQLPRLDESRISEDVVSVPLDDIQVQDADPQAIKFDENPAVPLSDAPLIGAPFRLISYFTRYVSGADLVNQNSSKSGR